jgi:hypothetical protein
MEVIIKDYTKEILPLRKIELVACLQADRNSEGSYYFYDYDYSSCLKNTKKIYKIASSLIGGMDLILCDDNKLFLGFWNDGVL